MKSPPPEYEVHRRHPVSHQVEIIGIFTAVLLYLVLRLWGLWDLRLNRFFDEGVHLSLIRMLATGQGALYRDLFFIHPPGVIQVGSWVWRMTGGNLFLIRAVYILFCSLTTLPLYALARTWFGTRTALITLFLFAITPGFAGWLGQSLYLEQPLNVLLYFALWLLLGHFRAQVWSSILAGIVLGIAFLVKETVVLIIIGGTVAWFIALYSPLEAEAEKPYLSAKQLAAFILAWVVTLATVVVCLSTVPNYIRDTVTLNMRDPYNLSSRLYELQNGLFQLPFQLTFGLAGLCFIFKYNASRSERFLGAFGLLLFCLLLITPKRLFWRHLIPIMPLAGIGVALCWERVYYGNTPRNRRIALNTGLLLCGLVSLVTYSLYHLSEKRTPASSTQALSLLTRQQGTLFTLDPTWAVASGRPLPKWQYACDAIYAFQFKLVPTAEIEAVVRSSRHILLNKKTVSTLPPSVVETIRQEYRSQYRHGTPSESDYVEVLEKREMVERE
jgi:4-amino-4-deoxy-L-arabinose transferase-like glycosyltransferase